jgi:hypothetical protein
MVPDAPATGLHVSAEIAADVIDDHEHPENRGAVSATVLVQPT